MVACGNLSVALTHYYKNFYILIIKIAFNLFNPKPRYGF